MSDVYNYDYLNSLLVRNRNNGNTTAMVNAAKECGGTVIVSCVEQKRRIRNEFDFERVIVVSETMRGLGKDAGPLFMDNQLMIEMSNLLVKTLSKSKEASDKLNQINKILGNIS